MQLPGFRGPTGDDSQVQSLVVKLTCDSDDGERVAQAFAVATAAIGVGADVSVWLAGDSVALGMPGRAEELVVAAAPRLADLRDLIVESGRLTVCGPCLERRSVEPDSLLVGVRVAGAAVFVEEVLADNTQALVY